MRIARILGAIGRTFISAGVITLLFVAYQLWGTGIQHARAQNELENDFEALLEEASLSIGTTTPTATPTPEPEVESVAATPTPSPEPTPEPTVDPRLFERKNGEAVFKLEIPRIGIDEVVVEGVEVEDLRKGPGHYRSTPWPGQPGNAAIAGHRTTYGAPFHRIDELSPGDEIVVTTIQGEFTYRVNSHESNDGKGHYIVEPSETWVLDDFDDNRITLTACHPKYSAAQRIIVTATLVEEPAPAPVVDEVVEEADELPTEEVEDRAASLLDDDEVPSDGELAALDALDEQAPLEGVDGFGEGLNGDRSAILPATTWGIAAGAVWLAAWYVGRHWRKWTMYFVGLTPFLVLLFMAFVHIDEALPSY